MQTNCDKKTQVIFVFLSISFNISMKNANFAEKII